MITIQEALEAKNTTLKPNQSFGDIEAFAWSIIDREISLACLKTGTDKTGPKAAHAYDVICDAILNGAPVPDNHPSPKGFITIWMRYKIQRALGQWRERLGMTRAIDQDDQKLLNTQASIKHQWNKSIAKTNKAKRRFKQTLSRSQMYVHAKRVLECGFDNDAFDRACSYLDEISDQNIQNHYFESTIA